MPTAAETPAETTPAEDTGTNDADAALESALAGYEDGPVTFTRPGIESHTFVVKDGKISTTKARREWLADYVTGVPVTD